MGVKNLWDILESCKKTLPLHHLQNKRLCVDLSCWMVQLQSVNRSHCPLKDKVYLKGLFHRLRALIALNCRLIFVTDGAIPAIKLSTYRRRLNSGNQAIQDAENLLNVSSVKRNMGSEFSCMIKEAKSLGMALGIPCLNGIEEAEAQCALLNSESLCDGCFTSDSDAFLFGARTVYRDICLGEGGYIVCYEMDDIERELGFGRNSLIALAILLGSDYTPGVRGFGRESACQIVKSIGDSVVLHRFASEGLSIVRKQKNSRKKVQTVMSKYKENNADHGRDFNGSECGLSVDNQFLQLINAYLKPKCHSADSDVVHRVLAVFPFNHSQLHQICAQYFEWPPEKTDEYILPKIAERNLRRFANLRSTSSGLGLYVPINEMPVKCPISSIIKQRKIQGRDYFEVSWEDVDGLKASSVPADLVESACPEKIMEFQQRKAQKQKPARRSRPKKAENGADMKEIDKKLQELVLEFGQESSTMANAVRLGGLVPEKTHTLVNFNVHEQQHLNTESKSSRQEGVEINSRKSSSSVCNFTPSRYLETEIIDLISPPPRIHTSRVSKCQEMGAIDLNACASKPKKADNSVDTVEVDEKLQKLLLDIEHESIAMTTVAHVDVDKLRMHPNTGLASSSWEGAENDNRGSFNSSCFSTSSKMIDLVSPPPRAHAHEVLKWQDARCIDVIDLSDTDNDVSPEHARNVEELRSFIASIRDEIS